MAAVFVVSPPALDSMAWVSLGSAGGSRFWGTGRMLVRFDVRPAHLHNDEIELVRKRIEDAGEDARF